MWLAQLRIALARGPSRRPASYLAPCHPFHTQPSAPSTPIPAPLPRPARRLFHAQPRVLSTPGPAPIPRPARVPRQKNPPAAASLFSCTLPPEPRAPSTPSPGPEACQPRRVHQLVGKVVSPDKSLAHAASPGRPSGAATGATENIIRRGEHANYSACCTLQPPRHKLRADSPPIKLSKSPQQPVVGAVPRLGRPL